MINTALESFSKKPSTPILIVDRKGDIGRKLAEKLSKDFLVVSVSANNTSLQSENIIHIPFRKRIPEIPENTYSHIFLISDTEIIISSISSFAKKAEADRAKFFIILDSFLLGSQKVNQILSQAGNSYLFIIGDLFSDESNLNDRTINKFIDGVKKNGKIEIEDDGLRISYPVHIDDVVEKILENSFEEKVQKVNYILPYNGVSDLSLSHLFQKKEPSVKTDFAKSKKQKREYFLDVGNYLLGKNYPLENRIGNLDLGKEIEKDNSTEISEKEVEKSYLLPFLWILFFCLFFLFLPLLTTLVYAGLGAHELTSAKDSLLKGDFQTAQKKVDNSKSFFDTADKTSKPLLSEAKLVGKGEEVGKLTAEINFGRDLSVGSSYLIQSFSLFDKVFKNKSTSPQNDFTEGTNLLKTSIAIIRREEGENLVPKGFQKEIKNLDTLLDLASNTSDFFPELFGFKKEEKYLVLFQNNMELRPGGGFIGSYGLLKIDKGNVSDFKINDVYTADGQLKAHIEPPFPIRRYLPSAHWFLRDSNFDLNFDKNASNAAYFLNLETTEKVDGVIGVDLSFVKNLLQNLGPVYLPDYNKTVTSENFFLLAEQNSEKNFFPGSTQKKDFLLSLFSGLLGKISQNQSSYLSIMQSVSDSLSQKHILFGFNNSALQNIFDVNDWSGIPLDTRVVNSNSINDYIGINEANIGINKVNYFVSRSVSQTVSIRVDGTITEKLTLAIKNMSKNGEWPGGIYKNYLRFVLPKNVTLNKIIIDNTEQKIVDPVTDPLIYERKGFSPPTGLEVEQYEENQKNVYAFLVNIPPQKLELISLSYTFNKKISGDNKTFTYSLKLSKQPGVDSFPFDSTIIFPANFKPIDSSQLTKDNKIIYSSNIDSDFDKEFTFSQK